MLELSDAQNSILKKIISWFDNKDSSRLSLGGYAGTGKTTLIGYLSLELRQKKKPVRIAFCSYTGKASRVLKNKLEAVDAIFPDDYIGTIHRLIYTPEVDGDNQIIGWKKIVEGEFQYDLIVVDEASMINEWIWGDLTSFNVPILAVGDHGQLPPIDGTFNLMEKPDLKLEEIYRQHKDNPIIYLSQMAREHGRIPPLEFGEGVRKMLRSSDSTQEYLGDLFSSFDDDMLVLVGYNSTRVKLNSAIRKLLEFESEAPMTKDRVICLRNNHYKQIYNGMMGRISQIEFKSDDWSKYYNTTINLDDEQYPFEGRISYKQFGAKQTLHNEKNDETDLFDFGYAVTVHKAQGSQAKRVVIFEEKFAGMEKGMWKRWLYTAITRASEQLYIVG